MKKVSVRLERKTPQHFGFLAPLAFIAALTVGGALPSAQQAGTDDWCRGENWGNNREGVCEVREYSLLAGAGSVEVDAAPNGGIQVQGSGRGDIIVRAKVVAVAATEQRARDIAAGVRVDAAPDKVTAEGPSGLERNEYWSVSYRLEVPTRSSMSLRSTNGGISINDVEGKIEFRTVNGGVTLNRLGGEVRGRTSNGGVTVDLDGQTWRGTGLDVETSNGGVKLSIPAQYSAHLDAGTVNGGFNIDFPLTVQGRIDREITADIGAGGPLIRVRTNNGGVRVTRK
jgi:putative adhesin